jgi:hypothetical protein
LAIREDVFLSKTIKPIILDAGNEFWSNLNIIDRIIGPIADGIAILESDTSSIADLLHIFRSIETKLNEVCNDEGLEEDVSNAIYFAIKKRKEFLVTDAHLLANMLHPVYRGVDFEDLERFKANNYFEEYLKKKNFWDDISIRNTILESFTSFKIKSGFFTLETSRKSASLVSSIHWWQSMTEYRSVYDLSKIALTLLSYPSSVERIFSKQALIHTKQRNRLSNERVEKLLAVENSLQPSKSKQNPCIEQIDDIPNENEIIDFD